MIRDIEQIAGARQIEITVRIELTGELVRVMLEIRLDLETGREVWRSSNSFGDYWSMVRQGDRILALDSDGELFQLRATPEAFTVLERRSVSSSPTWGHLAVVDGQLFVRELNAISAFSWR